MSATEDFERFRAEKREREATENEGRVTWRRTSEGPHDHGYSGIGAGGRLVYVVPRWSTGSHRVFDFGLVGDGGVRSRRGSRDTLREAKAAAADLLREENR